MKKPIRLSASTFKTFQNCSWNFFAAYHLQIATTPHKSLPKGSLIHKILEILLKNNKRRELAKELNRTQSLDCAPSIERLIRKTLNKFDLNNFEDYKDVRDWLFVGLKDDYFCEGCLEIKTEVQFEIMLAGEKVTGTIDRLVIYPDRILLQDWKSTRAKFSGEDASANLQSMLYLWVTRQLYPGYKDYDFTFIFLRFGRQPYQHHKYSEQQLDGFIEYIKYLIPMMVELNEDTAQANFAKDDIKKKWLCSAGKTWVCPYKNPFPYFWVTNKKGEFLYSCIDRPEKRRGQVVEERFYKGCPAWRSVNEKSQLNSFFD